MDEPAEKVTQATPVAPRCLSIDLEVGITDSRIHRFAALRGDTTWKRAAEIGACRCDPGPSSRR